MSQEKNMQQPREGGDDTLSNLERPEAQEQEVGYGNEERIAEDGEERNTPEKDERPSGSGIATKE